LLVSSGLSFVPAYLVGVGIRPERAPAFARRVALIPGQCDKYSPPPGEAKRKDPSRKAFVASSKATMTPTQVSCEICVHIEVDALEPDLLYRLYDEAIGKLTRAVAPCMPALL
jgi:hypothetical protein